MTLTVSIVIPTYNEAETLGSCLDAVAAQTVRPMEVLVVDNNSTDATVDVARSYSFVRVLIEQRQGVVFARDTGFTAARGDVIGRIDADTRPAPDWVASLQQIFTEPSLDAVSGPVRYHDMPFQSLFGAADLFFRRRMAGRMPREVFLYGANMAIRASAWRDVHHEVCRSPALHEDFDLAIHLAGRDPDRVRFAPGLRAHISARRVDTRFSSFSNYVLTCPRTYSAHGLRRHRRMYSTTALLLATHAPVRLLYRAYGPRGFSVSRVLDRSRRLRPSPVTSSARRR